MWISIYLYYQSFWEDENPLYHGETETNETDRDRNIYRDIVLEIYVTLCVFMYVHLYLRSMVECALQSNKIHRTNKDEHSPSLRMWPRDLRINQKALHGQRGTKFKHYNKPLSCLQDTIANTHYLKGESSVLDSQV